MGGPSGARIDPVSGLLTWTLPANEHIGTYPIGVVVTDSGSPQLSETTTILVNVLDPGPAPAVVRASVVTKHGYAISLKFSQPLDPATGVDPNNYILIPVSRKKSNNYPVATPILLSASYNPKNKVVTLRALARVKMKQSLELTIIGTAPGGVAKDTGLLLAGVRKRPGTNYVAIVTGKRVKQI